MSRKLVGACILLAVTAGMSVSQIMPPPVAPTAGTVTWVAQYPFPSAPPKGQNNGKIAIFGEYTVNAGWSPNTAQVFDNPKAGGVPLAKTLQFSNGKIGTLNAKNQIVPTYIDRPPGAYQVWLVMYYTAPMTQPQAPLSTIVDVIVPP